jgi:hypothetical protein
VFEWLGTQYFGVHQHFSVSRGGKVFGNPVNGAFAGS